MGHRSVYLLHRQQYIYPLLAHAIAPKTCNPLLVSITGTRQNFKIIIKTLLLEGGHFLCIFFPNLGSKYACDFALWSNTYDRLIVYTYSTFNIYTALNDFLDFEVDWLHAVMF